jgi:hypothetical protein
MSGRLLWLPEGAAATGPEWQPASATAVTAIDAQSELRYPAVSGVVCMASDDAKEGPQAFAEKRQPIWRSS